MIILKFKSCNLVKTRDETKIILHVRMLKQYSEPLVSWFRSVKWMYWLITAANPSLSAPLSDIKTIHHMNWLHNDRMICLVTHGPPLWLNFQTDYNGIKREKCMSSEEK